MGENGRVDQRGIDQFYIWGWGAQNPNPSDPTRENNRVTFMQIKAEFAFTPKPPTAAKVTSLRKTFFYVSI